MDEKSLLEVLYRLAAQGDIRAIIFLMKARRGSQ